MLTWYLIAHIMYGSSFGKVSLTSTPEYQTNMDNTKIEVSSKEECFRLRDMNFGYECWATEKTTIPVTITPLSVYPTCSVGSCKSANIPTVTK